MRPLLIHGALAALAVAAVVIPCRADAAAPTCEQTDPASGQCLIWVTTAPNPASPSAPGPAQPSGAITACYWDPSKQGLTAPPAGPVPCSSADGYWSNAHNCYVQRETPVPPAGDPMWQGHQPGDGAVYVCYQPQTDMFFSFWSKSAPAASGAGPTPKDVAQVAIGRMNLSAISIGISPGSSPGRVGLVGMPVWMWVQSPTAQTYGPVTASASAGGITITASARVSSVTWDMGDGTQVTCANPGTPYVVSDGMRRSPTCGHVYAVSSANQPEGRFTVTATSHWVVTWSGAGQSGTIQLPGLSRSTRITIGEAQVLVQ